jgi:hypothetical protein
MTESEPRTLAEPSPEGDGLEGGKTAPGEPAGRRAQLDGASGGYGSQSGSGSSGGSGEGDPQDGDSPEAGTTGATGEAPTEWLRRG